MTGYIYFIKMHRKNLFKIGLTTVDVSKRLSSIQADVRKKSGDKKIKLKIYAFFKSSNLKQDESDLHSFFSLHHRSLFYKDEEWFELDCATVDMAFMQCTTPDSLTIADKLVTTESYIKNLEHQLNNPELNHYYTKDEFSALYLICDMSLLKELRKKRIKRLREWEKHNYRPDAMLEKMK